MVIKWSWKVAALTCIISVAGCASKTEKVLEPDHIDSTGLPEPDLTLNIPGLGPCTDNSDRTLYLNSTQPVVVLVHGCVGSAGRFRSLAQVFAFQKQQSVCFSYDDRDSLIVSGTQLVTALDKLGIHMNNPQMTVIGHSQGGLIARNAFTNERTIPLGTDLHLHLVTISSPYAGISAADHCALPFARAVSLGLVIPICKLISGDKWHEITYASDFIRKPGTLIEQVGDFLKIVTDERGSCRRYDSDNRCIEDDFVFSVEEQYFPAVDNSPQVISVEVKAGHAEIIGNETVTPDKLIAILQQQDILSATPPEKIAAFNAMLNMLYLSE